MHSALRLTAWTRRSQSTFSVGSLFDPGHRLPYAGCQDDQRRAGPGGALKAVLPHRLNGQGLFLPDPLFDSSFERLSLPWSSVWASSLHPCIHSLLLPPLPQAPALPRARPVPGASSILIKNALVIVPRAHIPPVMSCYGPLFCVSFASFRVMLEALPSVLCTKSVPSISPGVPLGGTQLPQRPLITCSGGFPLLSDTNDAVTDTVLPITLWTHVSSLIYRWRNLKCFQPK